MEESKRHVGRPATGRTTETVTLRLKRDLLDKVRQRGPINTYIRELIERDIEREAK